MSNIAPIPAVRTHISSGTEVKKPIPTPRTHIKRNQQQQQQQQQQQTQQISEKMSETTPNSNNTFSRRLRSLSNSSKQIAEDIGELMQDKKKAVIQGTRQSVRRITKRFNSFHVDDQQSNNNNSSKKNNDVDDDESSSLDIFNSISFQSPIATVDVIYNNINQDQLLTNQETIEPIYCNDDESRSITPEDEIESRPPPSHPPPPLPDDSIYDAPSSSSYQGSGSTSTNTSHSDHIPNISPNKPENYESVFPPFISSQNLSRSGSWKFYDSVKSENIYNDITDSCDNNSNSEISSVDIRNSLYENHMISPKNEQTVTRPSQSVIFQFDPLNSAAQEESTTADNTHQNDLKLLEELLQGDLYGNLSAHNTLDNWSLSNDSEGDDFVSPPPPPVRIDSLPDEEQPPPSPSVPTTPIVSSKSEKTRTSWFNLGSNEFNVSKTSGQNQTDMKKPIGWLKQFKEVLEKAPEVVRGSRNKDPVVQRPELEVKSFVHKRGMLYKVQGGPVEDLFGEYSGRWCVLENSSMICFADSSQESVREHFPSDTILSIQILQDPKFKYKYDNDDLHCFELNTTGKSRGGHIYGTRDISERRIWMQCIAESLTKVFGSKITSDYKRMGWCYLREGVSGKWMGAWIILSHRTLYYSIDSKHVKSMDLRKARRLALQLYQDCDVNPRTNDKGPNMVLDGTNLTLYLRMWTCRETKIWCHIVKLAAHNNGAYLDQQQLSKNDIPVLVEKSINYIYVHGSMSEGIYRKSGSNTAISEILTKFRKDAWAVEFTDKYTEHDVAAALKRFFRDLPEPLLSTKQRQYFYQVSLVKDRDERVRMYKAALDCLPPISLNTSKKLLGHLCFIASQSAKNRMTLDNLAAIWGPTLLHTEDKSSSTSSSSSSSSNRMHQQDIAVVKQLIELYKFIFPEDPHEIEQEKMMLKVLEQYSKSPQMALNVNNKHKAGDFRVWIYYLDKKGPTFNLSVGPNKTAFEICAELGLKLDLQVHELILEEVVLNEQLTRPIHHTEKVLDVVLKWSYWDEPDRKDNYLVLSNMSKYLDLIQDKHKTVVSDELKFADPKSKNFKVCLVEFAQAKLTCYKDKRDKTCLFEWNIEDIVWYFGHESKRNPHSRCTLTFIELKNPPKRTKNSIYFGHTFVFDNVTNRVNWVSAMLRARYQETLQTPAVHVNLMTN